MTSITTTESLHYLTASPWNIPSVRKVRDRDPLLITVSGNHSLGKSAFMHRLGARVYLQDNNTILIDESAFRHPPHSYGLKEAESNFFSLIVNMMAQRDILINSWLNCGFNVIIERSFTEDLMLSSLLNGVFLLSKDEITLHTQLHDFYVTGNRKPDCVIYFNHPAECSKFNHKCAFKEGFISAFFCGGVNRVESFSACHSLYSEFLQNLCSEGVTVMEHNYECYEDTLVSEFMHRFF
ncbi:hypothetical protein [Erwinia sp. LJJL01]|uniref:hypothetical protein n=1 Tax=Erwinia sp. LJJL01 TaxID=3391839 RepID=UPI00105BCD40